MADESRQPTTRDEQLIRSALGGHAAAFGTLVERYWKMVVAMALTRIADPTTAGHGEPLYDGNLLNRQDERKGANYCAGRRTSPLRGLSRLLVLAMIQTSFA